MHVCSRIVKVVSTKSIVIISSKDRDTRPLSLRQGKNSVEEYYQELQTGMIRCGIVEENEAMLARFLGGLNREIQTILDYKEYTNITRLFHLACKAEREVQDRQALARTNFSAGRPSSGHCVHLLLQLHQHLN